MFILKEFQVFPMHLINAATPCLALTNSGRVKIFSLDQFPSERLFGFINGHVGIFIGCEMYFQSEPRGRRVLNDIINYSVPLLADFSEAGALRSIFVRDFSN